MAVHRPLGRLGLQAGCRKNALLLLAVLLCFQPFTQHAAARVMARTPELQAAAGQTAVAQSAAGKPQPEQVPMQQPTAAPPATAAATDAQQQTRLAASRQARAAAQGSKQHGAPLPLSTAAAKREAWKAAFRARQAAGAAAAASTIAVASAGAEGQPRPQPQVVEGLPELIPLPLLFGELKYTNPQVWCRGRACVAASPLASCVWVCYAVAHICVVSWVCVGCQPAALQEEACQCDSLLSLMLSARALP